MTDKMNIIVFQLWAIATLLGIGITAFVYEASRFIDHYRYWIYRFFEEDEDE